jgi:hypothetical protein
MIVLLEPRTGGRDRRRGRPVLEARAGAGGLLQVPDGLRPHQYARQEYRSGGQRQPSAPPDGTRDRHQCEGGEDGERDAKVSLEAVGETAVGGAAASEEQQRPQQHCQVGERLRRSHPPARQLTYYEDHAHQPEPRHRLRGRRQQVPEVIGRLGAYGHRHGFASPPRLLLLAEQAGGEASQVVGVPGVEDRE